MKSSLLLLQNLILGLILGLISTSVFAANDVIPNTKVLECIVGVHGLDDGKIYQQVMEFPLDGVIKEPLLAEIRYLNNELLLKGQMEVTTKDRYFTLQLFDDIAIGRLGPDVVGSDKLMWAHSLGILSFAAAEGTDIPRNSIEVKVQGAKKNQEALSAYVTCKSILKPAPVCDRCNLPALPFN